MQSSSFSFRLPKEDEEKLLSPHEYIRDTLSFRYQSCISCGTRTEFTCINVVIVIAATGRRKKEQVEKIELRNNLKDFYLSLSKDRDDGNSQKLKSQKQEQKENNESTTQRETKKWGALDALGQPAEPICTYYRCHHKFSLHGSRRCRCKHPTNKTLGIFVKYH